MSTQPTKQIWEGSRRLVGPHWTRNKSWEGSRKSTQPMKEIWEGSRRLVGLCRLVGSRWTRNKSWEGAHEFTALEINLRRFAQKSRFVFDSVQRSGKYAYAYTAYE